MNNRAAELGPQPQSPTLLQALPLLAMTQKIAKF